MPTRIIKAQPMKVYILKCGCHTITVEADRHVELTFTGVTREGEPRVPRPVLMPINEVRRNEK